MPRMLAHKKIKLTWVTDIEDPDAPTVAELTAGIDLQLLVSANNFNLGLSDEEAIADPPLASGVNTSMPGRTTVNAEMDFFRFTTTPEDTAFTTFATSGIDGFLVCRKGKDHAAAYAAGDKVEVYEVVTGSLMPQTPDNNGTGYIKNRLKFHPQDFFTDRAAVVA